MNLLIFSDFKLRYQNYEVDAEPRIIELHGDRVNILKFLNFTSRISKSNDLHRFTTNIIGLKKIREDETHIYRLRSIHYNNTYD